jgi:mannose-6-phosphate isomerase-like protein (cupin superfamily)
MVDAPVEIKRKRPPTAYEVFKEEQGLPIITGVGIPDLSGLKFGKWERRGGRGCFIDFDGMEGVTGMYAIEVPSGGAINPEKHLYEEMLYVTEGRGTTEVWKEGSSKKQVFEWQKGSLFSIPMNAWYRLVNASSSPAVLVSLNNGPFIMDFFHNPKFVFENTWDFDDRYDGSDDYFKEKPVETNPWNGRPIRYTNVVHDLPTCDLPNDIDDQRAPGFKIFWLEMSDNILNAHVAEVMSGRYSKAHSHFAGAVLIMLAGKGYSITWPSEYGTRPWENGLGDFVKRQDYTPGGMASPGTGWFHAHLSTGKEPLRMLALRYGSAKFSAGFIEAHTKGNSNLDIKKGGRTIMYRDEDPQIRKDYIAALKANGIEFQMPESYWQ